jgi:hypothetical protein
VDTRFSVGVAITEPVRAAIRHATAWIPAIDTDGALRDGAEICDITGLVPDDGYPPGTRLSQAVSSGLDLKLLAFPSRVGADGNAGMQATTGSAYRGSYGSGRRAVGVPTSSDRIPATDPCLGRGCGPR